MHGLAHFFALFFAGILNKSGSIHGALTNQRSESVGGIIKFPEPCHLLDRGAPIDRLRDPPHFVGAVCHAGAKGLSVSHVHIHCLISFNRVVEEPMWEVLISAVQ